MLEQKGTNVGSNQMFGSQHTYVMPDAATEQEKRIAAKQAKARGEVALSLNPEELESLDATTLKRKYDTSTPLHPPHFPSSLVFRITTRERAFTCHKSNFK